MAASVATQQILNDNMFQNEKTISNDSIPTPNNSTPKTLSKPTSTSTSIQINELKDDETDQKLSPVINNYMKRFGIDTRDSNTRDNWIPRNPKLIRLTGKHPFNCEPPVPLLLEQGFITPNDLHYVRNHGPVPKLDWKTHRLIIDGLVSKQLTLSMDDIVKLPYREFPVTLVCAGNRRKEQNMVKQSIGFNWGAAAVSTAVWRGVSLSYILKMVGLSLDADYGEERHVCFVGADLLPNDYYGTSLPLDWSMNEAKDVLLAYQMNGEILSPDHGYPLRVIIPGVIGGRMVKWLNRITITNKESNNYYHYNDNRVLPPNVDAERATKEGWWYKPDYIINELNINSAVVSPDHDETLSISSFKSDSEYKLKGYAYSGGGRKVTRVEISLDDGKTWSLTDLEHPELNHSAVVNRRQRPLRNYWCWIFWSFSVPVHKLIESKEIIVRAWDCSNNTQPSHLTWNVMGMMNNCYFRVKIHIIVKGRDVALKFEHPTQAGPNPASEVEKHTEEDDCWIIVENKVYDCSKYLNDHPGGLDSILINAGSDCTEEFTAIHSDKAKNLIKQFYIGDLDQSENSAIIPDATISTATTIAPIETAPKIVEEELLLALDPKTWLKCPLLSIKVLSHDTRIYRFKLQSDKHLFGLPPGKHIFIRANINNKSTIRAYTPITTPNDPPGYFDLLIKVYFKNVHPKFPDGGAMTQYLDSLSIGDSIEIKGPLGSFSYCGAGKYQLKSGKSSTLHSCKRISMIAGGSGITPIYQVIKSVLHDNDDNTELALIYANKTEGDILLRKELDEITSKHPNIKIFYTLDNPTKDWKYGKGFVCEQMIRDNLYPPSSDSESIVLMCGPLPMIEYSCIPNLKKFGFKETEYFKF
ncbi:5393_t:CDS:2 [Entrophospora sp. SA101]|nr:5393_t:CDS:2 [Entrophospora sp. SA101]